jgi:CDP-diacylglycerol--glycerol-3-phosphate 3-phosphatidyltransferase
MTTTINPSNTLTVFRVLLIPVLVFLLIENDQADNILAAFIFGVAMLSDLADGYLARTRNEITDFGQLADPIADKLLVSSMFVLLVVFHGLEIWIASVILTREIIITWLRMKALQKQQLISANKLGKLKTLLQSLCILLLILFSPRYLWLSALIYLTLGVTVISGISYLKPMRKGQAKITP